MRWTVLLAVLLICVGATDQPAKPKLNTKGLQSYKVENIVDGDTIKVKMGDEVVTVRIIGVDTPEVKDPRNPVQYYGKEASAFTKKLLDRKRVYLEPDQGTKLEQDVFGRSLAHVWRVFDRKLVALVIIQNGYGHYYSKYPFKQDYMDLYRDAEKSAREQKLGLWKEDGYD